MDLQRIRVKYKDRYVEFYKTSAHLTESGKDEYEVKSSYKDIHENTTLGQDIGTEYEYRR